jgi:hypothetical protein
MLHLDKINVDSASRVIAAQPVIGIIISEVRP